MPSACVYLHSKPNIDTLHGVFYVGKSVSFERAKDLSGRNAHYARILAKYGRENVLVKIIPCSSEKVAFALEKELIATFKANGVCLSNMTDGGEGVSGYRFNKVSKLQKSFKSSGIVLPKHTEQARAKQSLAARGVKNSDDHNQAISESMKSLRYLNNGRKEVRSQPVDIDAYIALGFVFGRLKEYSERYAKMGAKCLGKRRVTNEIEERNVLPDEVEIYLAKGWRLGRKSRPFRLNTTIERK